MTHRERVLSALAHQEPDRVPFDLGSTHCTSPHLEVYTDLKTHFGLTTPTTINHKMLQAAKVEEPILQALDVDTRGVYLGAPDNWTDIQIDECTYVDEWGITRSKPHSCHYYDQVGVPPLGKEDLILEDIEALKIPDPYDPGRFRHLKYQVDQAKEAGDYAIVFGYGASFVHMSQYLRGMENWFVDTAWRPELLGLLMDRLVDEFYIPLGKRALEMIGEDVDIVFIGDDLGTQNSLMLSPDAYRSIIKPRQKKVLDMIHESTNAKVLFHSCGAIESIISDLIEVGVDILNPIQVLASGMEPDKLKVKYGDKLCFWGAIDGQRLLPFGKPEEVREEVLKLTGVLGRSGGYVVSSVNNIQPGVPIDNVLAMYEGVKLTRKRF